MMRSACRFILTSFMTRTSTTHNVLAVNGFDRFSLLCYISVSHRGFPLM